MALTEEQKERQSIRWLESRAKADPDHRPAYENIAEEIRQLLAEREALPVSIMSAMAEIRRLRALLAEAEKVIEPFDKCFFKPQTKYMMEHRDYDTEPLDVLTADGLRWGHLRAAADLHKKIREALSSPAG